MHERTIGLIQNLHRDRCYAMETRKSLDLRLGSYLRLKLGWRKDLPEAERKRIAKEAQKQMADKESENSMVIGTNKARLEFINAEKAALKAMEKLAVTFPVWETFGQSIRGFGAGSLAVIIAEAGDLANYSTKSKLWKRMGLAAGQGSVPKGLSPEKRKEAWIERGYNPRRRSRMWNIGDTLIKGNRAGVYRTCYLARKKYELERNPKMTPMHAHRRAQRYMEKRLLRDLWQAWRRSNEELAEKPSPMVTAAKLDKTNVTSAAPG